MSNLYSIIKTSVFPYKMMGHFDGLIFRMNCNISSNTGFFEVEKMSLNIYARIAACGEGTEGEI